MKKKALSLTLCVVLALALLPNTASAAGASPAVSSNKHAQQYVSDQCWAETVKSYLYANPSGGLTRVEYIGYYSNGKVVVEDYNSQFQLQSSRTIPMELPIWGGFFAGETCNFVIFGQKNPEASKETEVIRVVKYDKSWNRLGACSIRGANTCTPFMFGSLRCAEYGGHLYIHTCHQMYRSERDGLNHQANMLLNIRESDMEWVSGEIGLGTASDDYSYVSHSFNQFVLVDAEGHVVTLNHGDGYPRGLALYRNHAKAGQDKLFERMADKPWDENFNVNKDYDRYGESLLALEVSGKVGDNNTGVALGGFAETSSGYVMAYNYTPDYSNRYASRDVYMTYVDKETFGTGYWELTAGQVGDFYNPQLVSTGLDGGYILWEGNVFKKVYYARYEPTGGIGTADDAVKVSDFGAALSDCQPIVWNGQVVWYVTDNSAPVFYVLNENGITPYQTTTGDAPVQSQHPASPAVDAWARDRVGVAAGNDLVPEGLGNDYRVNITRAQFAAVAVKLYEAMSGQTAPAAGASPFSDTSDPAVLQAAELGFVSGIGDGKFGPGDLVTREEMAVMLSQVYTRLGGQIPAVTATAFADDSSISGWAKNAVAFMNGKGILSGKENNRFAPSGSDGSAKIEEALLVSLKMLETLK